MPYMRASRLSCGFHAVQWNNTQGNRYSGCIREESCFDMSRSDMFQVPTFRKIHSFKLQALVPVFLDPKCETWLPGGRPPECHMWCGARGLSSAHSVSLG